jgi:hypothetical protein
MCKKTSPKATQKFKDRRMGKYTSAAVLAVRLLGLLWLTAGLWMLAANILESVMEFNPSYIGYYLESQALRPLLAMGLGGLLLARARPLGRKLAKGLDEQSHG